MAECWASVALSDVIIPSFMACRRPISADLPPCYISREFSSHDFFWRTCSNLLSKLSVIDIKAKKKSPWLEGRVI